MKRALLPLLTLALAAATQASAISLVIEDPVHKIQKGELVKHTLKKSWPLPAGGVATTKKIGRLSTTLTPTLNRIERQVNARKPIGASFKNVGGSWVATDQVGWIFDRDGTKKNLLAAIKAGKKTARVAYKRVVPERDVRVLYGRGVRWFVASGQSSYAGSPSFRVKNILVGANKLDHFFIAPGHEFNFNEEVGKIDKSTGFVAGFVISGGTLEKEDGGGICQVSTTIFRALYQAGLPITERHEHSHRVKYYDPVGYEATVYAPAKNLRMKNDTGKHLFVQVDREVGGSQLRFNVFGAKTGRSVSISKPVISNFKAPKKPSYTADKNVAKGAQRKVDSKMQGMTSVITRTIKVGGKVTGKDTLKSVYEPWGDVYAVNPTDKRLKQ